MSICDFQGAAGKAILHRSDGSTAEYEAERVAIEDFQRVVDSPSLVFPYVTNQDGLDTEMVISNTTLDWLGTDTQAGSCLISYFGDNAPAAQMTSPLSAGQQVVFTASAGSAAWGLAGAPNFEGYVIADCDFDLARGMATIVTDETASAYPPELVEPPAAALREEAVAPTQATTSSLLLPYAASRDAFDTWISLSNTTVDTFGTTPEAGACTVSYHGDALSPAVAPQMVVLAAGQQVVWSLSGVAAGFSGSLSVSCDFPNARGAAVAWRGSSAAFAQRLEAVEPPRSTIPTPVAYPFVANIAGFDTGVVLVDTTEDAFGTTPQDGVCQLSFSGEVEGGGAGPADIGVLVEAGEPLVFNLSEGVPSLGIQPGEGFTGYLYSDCGFPLARGFSYLQKELAPSTTGVFRPSTGGLFLKSENTAGFADRLLTFGLPGDKPVTGDWDDDNVDTIGVYRNGVFYLRNSNTNGFADVAFGFGLASDLPVVGDWDGDGVDTVGVFRTGLFILRNSNDSGAADAVFALGVAGDIPISGDWDGDGVDTVGVFRPSTGALFLKNQNSTGFADIFLTYGVPDDKPVTGDWDGDGVDTIGVFRNGVFLLRNSNTNGFADIVFGLGVPGDEPISGAWGPLQ